VEAAEAARERKTRREAGRGQVREASASISATKKLTS
jgi:hypothetical protein